ncbi:lipopolysaccharide biosynthesis protein [Candidatus Saccharibacteria bacterium]|nr:lipopolysaccharide biosynthesis protein [Candidatus Saccharibacteria bacterium]
MRSKKALYNIISNIILQVVIIISGFIVPKIIISTFGSTVNGLVSSVTQFLAYITLLESGFGPVVKAALYKPIANEDNKTIGNILKTSERFFRIIAVIFLGYIAILCLFYPTVINHDFEWAFTASLIIIIGISTFAEYFFGMTYTLFLQAKQKKYIISNIQICTYVLSTLSVIVLAKMGAGIHLIKLISGVIFILRPLILNVYVKKKYKLDYTDSSDSYKLDKKWDGLAQHIAYVIHTKTDVTVLTIFSTLSEVSVYSVYYLVVRGIKAIIGAFSGSIDATFGDMIAKNEKQNLNKKFSMFEVLYGFIGTVSFATAIVLITPFVSVYMKGATDANYIRPVFGILIVISEYIWAIRQPYNSIILAAGHFKETRRGAWIECLTNIIISIILVGQFGLVGVAIGTTIAMTIRTAEFVYHTNKFILDRSIWESVKKILLIIIETIIIVLVSQLLPFLDNTNYLNWSINALMVFSVACIVTLAFNYVFYRAELKASRRLIKRLLPKRRKSY